jgi:hypothetical protein
VADFRAFVWGEESKIMTYKVLYDANENIVDVAVVQEGHLEELKPMGEHVGHSYYLDEFGFIHLHRPKKGIGLENDFPASAFLFAEGGYTITKVTGGDVEWLEVTEDGGADEAVKMLVYYNKDYCNMA